MLLIKLAGKDRAKVWAETEALNRLPEVVVETAWTTLPFNLAAAKVPVKPRVKVLAEILPVMLASLVTKPTKVVPKVEELVPPLATGRMPEISEVKEAWPL